MSENNTKQTNGGTRIVSPPVPFIRARIDNLFNNPDNPLKAFASITIGGHFAIHGIKIFDDDQNTTIGFPAVKSDKNGKSYEQAHSVTAEARAAVTKYVIDAYKFKLEKRHSREQKGNMDNENTEETSGQDMDSSEENMDETANEEVSNSFEQKI